MNVSCSQLMKGRPEGSSIFRLKINLVFSVVVEYGAGCKFRGVVSRHAES